VWYASLHGRSTEPRGTQQENIMVKLVNAKAAQKFHVSTATDDCTVKAGDTVVVIEKVDLHTYRIEVKNGMRCIVNEDLLIFNQC
jgi:hypothetical protein